MSARELRDGDSADVQDDEKSGFRCDFCGLAVTSVQRVALDGEYERLRTPHNPLYACPTCSERKERERQEAAAG